jgi:hypothetical protein
MINIIINNIVGISKIESGQLEVNMQETNINEQIECIHTFFKLDIEANTCPFRLLFKTERPKKTDGFILYTEFFQPFRKENT